MLAGVDVGIDQSQLQYIRTHLDGNPVTKPHDVWLRGDVDWKSIEEDKRAFDA